MAIKVNGTTVIDDSRNLSNVGGLKTINSTSILGSGNISAGASTTAGAVGTYVFGMRVATGAHNFGSTYAGSTIYPASFVSGFGDPGADNYNTAAYDYSTRSGTALSGTWRIMGQASIFTGDNVPRDTLWVRIS